MGKIEDGDCVCWFEFGGPTDEKSVNGRNAVTAGKIAHQYGIPLFAQKGIHSLIACAEPVDPPSEFTGWFGTFEVGFHMADMMRTKGLSRPIIVCQRRHTRCLFVMQHFGFDVIIPSGLAEGYCGPKLATMSLPLWFAAETVRKFQYRWEGKI